MKSSPALAAALLLAIAAFTSAQEPAGGGPDSAGRGRRPRTAPPPEAATIPASWIESLRWRCIGPAAMGGRITSIAVSQQDPNRWWAATASGGLLRTTNDGTTFDHQFDREAVVSIGDVAVAPSNHDVVWVGTGENNPRNSVSWGNGVYKSTDGGASWKHMGLAKSFQIGRIVIHPANPDIVYVGALGRLWGPSEERGLYKTTDGGKSWERILHVDDKTGVIELRMHPADPETLLAATWERQRDGFDTNDPAKKWGPGAGLWRSSDGGRNWTRVTDGLPKGQLGRIGIDWLATDPDVVYMVLESEQIGRIPEQAGWIGVRADDADAAARISRVTPESPAQAAGLKEGDLVIGIGGDRVLSADDLVAACRSREIGAKVEIEVLRERVPLRLEMTLAKEPPPRAAAGEGRGPRGAESERGGEAARDEAGRGAGAEAARTETPRGGGAEAPSASPPRTSGSEEAGQSEAGPTGAERGADVPRPLGDRLGGQNANQHRHQSFEGNEYAGVYKSTDGGRSWARVNSLNPRPMYFSQVRVDATDPDHVWVLGIDLHHSRDGGASFKADGGRGTHADHHALWIDPRDGRHLILGNDGGVYVSRDRGANWDHLNHAAIGQFYHVALDTNRNFRVYGGLQDNGSWGGPARVRWGAGPANEDWFRIGSGDGFVCRVDPDDPEQLYYESQNGALGRRNLRTGERASIRPEGTRDARWRWNWNTPFLLSRHNPRIYYTAANVVFRSLDRGRTLRRISPEITLSDRGSATALAESPLDEGLLFAGTDDGAVWRTRDGGREWTSLFQKPAAAVTATTPGAPGGGDGGPNAGRSERASAGEPDVKGDGATRERVARRANADTLDRLLPGPRWVSALVCSRSDRDRVYAAFDGHRSDDDAAYLFVSQDGGDSWRSLAAKIPAAAGSVRALEEDLFNPDLLWLGCEFGAWVSIDRGASWTELASNLPTVAVHGFAQHPTSGEIVAATHGRSLWILDVTALRQVTRETLSAPATLYKPAPAIIWKSEPSRGSTNRRYAGENPPSGARIAYSLGRGAREVVLEVRDRDGRVLRSLETKADAGLQVATWDLRRLPTTPPAAAPAPGAAPTSRTDAPPGGGRGRGRRGQRVAPGSYSIVLQVDGRSYTEELVVEIDPDHPKGPWLDAEGSFGGDEDEADEEEEEREGGGPPATFRDGD